jgi:nucleoside-diphosphate kinase
MEKTLVLVKPDGVKRGLSGEIIARFERRGLRVAALKMSCLTRELAEKHYAEHVGKPFFSGLVDFITSGPIIAMVLEGENSIRIIRTMMGTTNPTESAPGTIRGDLAISMSNNVVHGSDGPESALREINLFFDRQEIF